MKIFGIGLNKTGTKTLGACMTQLGFRNKSFDIELLKKYQNGDKESIMSVINDFDSFEDWPWPLMFKDLESKVPESKFILTTRKTPEIWFESLCKHAKLTGPTEARKIVYGYFMPDEFQVQHIQRYCQHYDDVIQYFKEKQDKLLVVCWENGSSWQDLSTFLGVSAPDLVFPHMNKS